MYIGQMGTNPWLKTSWLNRAGFQQISKNMSNTLPKEHTQQQTKSVNTDRFQLSSSYPRFPNQMKILENRKLLRSMLPLWRRIFAPLRRRRTPKKMP